MTLFKCVEFHNNIYRPQRSCGQGYVFTRVCHSVNGGGVLSQHALQEVSQHALQQVSGEGVLSQHALQEVSQHAFHNMGTFWFGGLLV